MVNKGENIISKTIGQRLRESREICNYTQNQAAQLLGIDPKELASYENAIDLDGSIPNWLIAKAAMAYDVTTDYIYGVADDWESDLAVRCERDTISFINRIHIQDHAEQLAKIMAVENKVSVMTDAVKTLAPAIKAIDDAMNRFREINPKFDDMPAGSTVLNRIDTAINAAQEAKCQMIRFKVVPLESDAG